MSGQQRLHGAGCRSRAEIGGFSLCGIGFENPRSAVPAHDARRLAHSRVGEPFDG